MTLTAQGQKLIGDVFSIVRAGSVRSNDKRSRFGVSLTEDRGGGWSVLCVHSAEPENEPFPLFVDVDEAFAAGRRKHMGDDSVA